LFNEDTEKLQIYVNGVLENESTGVNENPQETNSNTEIGRQSNVGSRVFNGSIDNVRIYNYSLSSEQILALYNNRTDLIVSDETSIGDNWSACVTPNDGTEDGLKVCSNNVTILEVPFVNTIPVVENVTLNSSLNTNLTTENLAVYYDTYDADNDHVFAQVAWYLNGTFDHNYTKEIIYPENYSELFFPFNVTGSPTTDYSKNSHSGTVINAVWNATGGIYDGAYEFDGDGDYITAPSNDNWTFGTADFTVSVWVKFDIIQNSGTGTEFRNNFLGTYHGGNSNRWLLAVGKVDDNFTFNFNNVGVQLVGPSPSIDTWHHVVVSRNSGTTKMYVNGVEEDSTSSSMDINTADFLDIGYSNAYTDSNRDFDGTIDEVKIYHLGLSAEEVKALYWNHKDIIASSLTSVGDNWSACVTPNDGIEDGIKSCSNNVTILETPFVNTAPQVDSIYLNATSSLNVTTDNLTLNLAVSDTDGHSITNITNWYLNGSSITVLNMPFEKINGTDSNNAWDYSGYGNNGSEEGGVTWNSTGYIGGAYKFDGVDDYIQIGDIDAIDVATELSICAWVRHEGTEDDDEIIAKNNAGTDGFLFFRDNEASVSLRTDTYTFFVADSTDTDTARIEGSTSASVANVWTHVCGVFVASDNLRLFINGIEDANSPVDASNIAAIDTGSNPLVIGASSTYGAPYNGTIDEVLIFNRSLSSEQIINLYENKTYLLDANETSVGDNWSACVTPNDGIEDGIKSCSNNVTILEEPFVNTAPVVDSISLNASSENNYTTDNLTLQLTVSDTDGDNITNITNWYLNGTSITVLNMPFENNGSNGGHKDYSEYENNATSVTATWNSTGYLGGAYEFDTESYIDVTDDSTLDITDAITISAWVKVAASGPISYNQYVVDKQNRYSLLIEDDENVSFYGSNFGGLLTTNDSISLNEWHHIVGTYDKDVDDDNARVYIDGVLSAVSTEAASLGTDDNPVRIGCYSNAGGVCNPAWGFNGTIDEVRIYNHSLSPEQIQALYNNRTDLIVSQETSSGDNWSACVTPNDGYEDGTTNCSNNVTIEYQNVAPNTAQVILNATSVYNRTVDNLTCYANITDSDTTMVYANFTWYNGSQVVREGQYGPFGESNLMLIDTLNYANTTIGENWTCEVKAYDNENYETDWNNDSVIIENICFIEGTVTDPDEGYVASGIYLYDELGQEIASDDQEYFMAVECNNTYDFTVIPDSGDLVEISVLNFTLTNDVSEILDMEDSTWTNPDIPESIGNVSTMVSWYPHLALNFSYVNVTMTYNGSNLTAYKCLNWNYTDRNCTDDNWTYNDSVPDGYFNVSELFAPGDPAKIIAPSARIQSYVKLYDVTSLVDAGRMGGGSLVGTYYNASEINFTFGKSYRVEMHLNNTHENSNSIIREPYYHNIPAELTIDTDGTDSPNITIVDGSIDVNSFTINISSDSGVSNITWQAVSSNNKVIEKLHYNEVIKLWFVVDYSTRTFNTYEATFFGDVEGTDFDAKSINQFNTQGNSLPVVDIISLNATSVNNYTTDNLTLNLVVSDIDNDDVKNITNWYLNGSSITVLNMPFEKINNTDTDNAWDYSGYNNNGSDEGGIVWNSIGGYDGRGAYEFDGVDDYINVSTQSFFRCEDEDVSVSLWFKTSGLYSDIAGVLFSSSDVSWNPGRVYIDVVNETGALRLIKAKYNGSYYSSMITAPTPVNDNAWHHVVVTCNSSNYGEMYLDGSYVNGTSLDTSIDSSPKVITVGATNGGTYLFFNGTIDNLQVYNKSLSSEQVLALYNNRTDLIVSQETSKGDNWSACVTPNDGTEDGLKVCSNNVTILNSAPYFDPALTSQNAYTNQEFIYDINCSDADGDSVVYFDDTNLFDINYTTGLINDTPQIGESGVYNIEINCSDDVVNTTSSFTYTIHDADAPSFSNALNTSINFRKHFNFTANITIDNDELDMYLFSTNASGTWTNTSLRDISGAQYNATESANITVSQGTDVCWYYWANDTASNNVTSSTYCFTVQNTIPTAPSISMEPASPLTTDDLYCNVTTNSTDVDNDTISYTYVWYKNHVYDSKTGPKSDVFDTLSNTNTAKGEVWNCTVVPYDGVDNGTNVTTSLTILNTAPEAQLVNLISDDYENRTNSTLTGAWTFADNDADTEQNNETLWYNNSVLISEFNNNISIDSNNISKGETWIFSVRVNDGTVWSSWINSTSLTINNAVPEFNETLVNQDGYSGQPFTYQINCTDIDEDTITYFDNTNLFDIDANGLISDTPSGAESGAYPIIINCSDGTVNATQSFTYTIHDADAPTFSNALNVSDNFRRYFNFTANITIDNDELDYYLFSTNASGTWTNTSARDISGEQYNATESANITLSQGTDVCWYYWANDTASNNVTSTTYCFTVQNTIPTAPTISMEPASPLTTDDLYCNVTTNSTDVDNNTITYTYVWYKNNVYDSKTGPTSQLYDTLSNTNTAKGEVWNCTVVPYDGVDNGTNVTTSLTILNTVPQAQSVSLTSDDTLNRTNGTLTGAWIFADNDTDTEQSNETLWYNNSVLVSELNNLISINSSNTTKDESWIFSVRVNDGSVWSDWINSTSLIINNAVPEFNETLVNQDGYSGQPFTYQINCTDIDEDTITYFDNTNLFDIDANGLISDTPSGAESGAYSIIINCSDGTVNATQSFTYTIHDADAPSFSNALNISTDFKRYSNFTANITIDNDALDFYIFSTNVTGTWTNTSARDISGEQYNATESANITVSQGTDVCWYYWANDTASNNVTSSTYCFTVQNTIPTAPSISMEPALPQTTDDLICNVTTNSTDLDDDTVNYTYVWSKNDVYDSSVGPKTDLYDTLSNSNTAKGEVWNCTVVPYDGVDNGTNVTDSLTIQNTQPQVDTISLNATSEENTTSDNLTLQLTVSDIDSDSITNITNWYLNGTSITVLNMPFEKINGTDSNNAWDYSGYNNNGSDEGGIVWNSIGGYDGKGAYEFDGVDDYINISDNQIFNFTDHLTVSAWIYVNSSMATWQGVISKCDGSSASGGYCILYEGLSPGNNKVNFMVSESNAVSILKSQSMSLGSWHHVVGVFDTDETGDSQVKLYVDGIEGGTYDSQGSMDTITANDYDLIIGDKSNMGRPFNGSVDEVLIFNRSLSTEQILNLYNNKTYLIDSSETSIGDNWSACVTPNDGTEDGTKVCSNNITILLTNATIDTWDDTDNQTKFINQLVDFYTNYTDENYEPINGTGVYCEIAFNLTGTWQDEDNMTYNTTTEVYDYNRTFSSKGTYPYKTVCDGSIIGYGTAIIEEETNISNSPPVASVIPNITFAEDTYNDTTNLSNYFTDADNDALTFNIYNQSENITITITGEIANITAQQDFNGEDQWVIFNATDGTNETVSNNITVNVTSVRDYLTINNIYTSPTQPIDYVNTLQYINVSNPDSTTNVTCNITGNVTADYDNYSGYNLFSTNYGLLVESTYYYNINCRDEQDEHNLTDQSFTVIAADIPDLLIYSSDITFDPEHPDTGQNFNINVNVRNDGPVDAEDALIMYYVDGDYVANTSVNVSAQSTQQATVQHSISTDGYHIVKVVIDENNDISEIDEDNNEASTTVPVGSIVEEGGITVVVTSAPTSLSKGQSFTVSGYAYYTNYPDIRVQGGLVNITYNATNTTQNKFTDDNGEFSSSSFSAGYTAGTYEIFTYVTDYTASGNSTNLTNVVEGVSCPDLAPYTDLTRYSYSSWHQENPSQGVVGEEEEFRTIFVNNGCYNFTDPVNISLYHYKNGQYVKINNLTFNDTIEYEQTNTTAWLNYTFDTSGTQNMMWGIEEIDDVPSNNNNTFTYYVYPATTDLNPYSVSVTGSPVYNDTSQTVRIYVRNNDGVAASNFRVNTTINGSLADSRLISIGGSGATTSFTFSYTFTEVGSNEIFVDVDTDNSVSESNEDNNNYTTSVTSYYIADLTPSCSYQYTNPLYVGDEINVTVTGYNNGNKDSAAYTWTVKQNDTVINTTREDDGTVAGSNEQLGKVNFTLHSGTNTIRVDLDTAGEISEYREWNNYCQRTFSPYDYDVDLSIDSIAGYEYSPSYYYSGYYNYQHQTFSFPVTVTNGGGADAENVKVYLYTTPPGGSEFLNTTYTIANVTGQGGTNTTYLSIDPEILGTYNFRLVVDPDDDITETNEGNNQRTSSRYIRYPDVYLTSGDINYVPSNAYYFEDVAITALIHNSQNYAASDCQVNWSIDSVQVNETFVTTVPASGSQQASIIESFNTPGYHVVEVKINNNNRSYETEPDNNFASRQTLYIYNCIEGSCPPVLSITYPDNDTVVTDNLNVLANFYDYDADENSNYTLSFYYLIGSNPTKHYINSTNESVSGSYTDVNGANYEMFWNISGLLPGNYSIFANASYAGNYTDNFTENFTIATQYAPLVTQPEFNETVLEYNVDVSANTTYTDYNNDLGAVNFTWYVNEINVHNESFSNVASGTTLNSTLNANNYTVNDIINVSVIADDGTDVSELNWSDTITVQDNQVPVVTLVSPVDDYNVSLYNVTLTCSATNLNLTNITLYTNVTGNWEANSTTSVTGTSAQVEFNLTGLEVGTYAWNCLANDTSDNSAFAANNRTFNVLQHIPTVTKPEFNETVLEYFMDISANTTYVDNNNDLGTVNFTWYVNEINVHNESFTTVANGTVLNSTLNADNYTVNDIINVSVIADDGTDVSELNWSDTITVVDNQVPVVTLVSPEDNLNSSESNMTLVCSATNLNLTNITLYTNVSGSWTANSTVNVTGTSAQVEFNLTGLEVGTYAWNCLANDSSENSAFATNNRTFNRIAQDYNLTLYVDGILSSTFDQTALPYTVTVNVEQEGVVVENAQVIIFEQQGNNIFIPLRQSGIISQAETIGTTDAEGNVTFIIAPTHYPVISDYAIVAGVLSDDEIISNTTFGITNNGSISFQKKPLTPSNLADNAKVAVNAMNSIINSLFIWANDEKEANLFDITVYTNGTVESSATLQTGAPNVLNITLKNDTNDKISGRLKAEESSGYLLFNPTYNPPGIGNKNHTHSYSYVNTSLEFIVTPTEYGAVDSNFNVTVYYENLTKITNFNLSIDPNLEPRNGQSYDNDALKVIINSMNSVVNSLFYALN